MQLGFNLMFVWYFKKALNFFTYYFIMLYINTCDCKIMFVNVICDNVIHPK